MPDDSKPLSTSLKIAVLLFVLWAVSALVTVDKLHAIHAGWRWIFVNSVGGSLIGVVVYHLARRSAR